MPALAKPVPRSNRPTSTEKAHHPAPIIAPKTSPPKGLTTLLDQSHSRPRAHTLVTNRPVEMAPLRKGTITCAGVEGSHRLPSPLSVAALGEDHEDDNLTSSRNSDSYDWTFLEPLDEDRELRKAMKELKKVLKVWTTQLLGVAVELLPELNEKTPELWMWLAQVKTYISLKQKKIPDSTAKIMFARSRIMVQAKV